MFLCAKQQQKLTGRPQIKKRYISIYHQKRLIFEEPKKK